jgi:hypothetical protein
LKENVPAGEHLLVPIEALCLALVVAATAINDLDGPSAIGHGAEVLIATSAE